MMEGDQCKFWYNKTRKIDEKTYIEKERCEGRLELRQWFPKKIKAGRTKRQATKKFGYKCNVCKKFNR